MMTRILTALAIAVATFQGSAMADRGRLPATDEQSAAGACAALFNDHGGASVVSTVEDGIGASLVALEDVDGNMWLCNANDEGEVVMLAFATDDVLQGQGAELIGLTEVGFGELQPHPARIAERLCRTVLTEFLWAEAVDVVTVPDGVGDYFVWLLSDRNEVFACNASENGDLYFFEYLGTLDA